MSHYPQDYQPWASNRAQQSAIPPAATQQICTSQVANFTHPHPTTNQQLTSPVPPSYSWNAQVSTFQSPQFIHHDNQPPYQDQSWYAQSSTHYTTHYGAAPASEAPAPQYSNPSHYSRDAEQFACLPALQQPTSKLTDQEAVSAHPLSSSCHSSDSQQLDNRSRQSSETIQHSPYQFELLKGARNVEKQPFSYQAYGRQDVGEPPSHLGLADRHVAAHSAARGEAGSDADPSKFQVRWCQVGMIHTLCN